MEDTKIDLLNELVDYTFLIGRQRGQGVVTQEEAEETVRIVKSALTKLIDIKL